MSFIANQYERELLGADKEGSVFAVNPNGKPHMVPRKPRDAA